jgi:hypothetical protein
VAHPDRPTRPHRPRHGTRGRLTRFLESARLAFARERNLWASLGIDEQVHISAPDGGYNVAVHKHIDAVDAGEKLHGSVPVQSHALAERVRAWFADDRSSARARLLKAGVRLETCRLRRDIAVHRTAGVQRPPPEPADRGGDLALATLRDARGDAACYATPHPLGVEAEASRSWLRPRGTAGPQ